MTTFVTSWLLMGAVAAPAAEPADTAILALKIVPMEGSVIDNGVLLLGGGTIVGLGPREKIEVPPAATVIDASDRWVMPGIVEAHCHMGLDGGLNDMVFPINPDLAVGDCIDFESRALKFAVAEGVTTINTMPGSGTNHAGYSVIVKTAGEDREQRLVRDPGCMKIAQAYNPERDSDDMGGTRMGMAYLLRRHLREGKAYAAAWREYEEGKRTEKPALRRDLERIRLVFAGKVPVINHTYSGWGVAESIRLFREEFGLDLIATHTAFGGFQSGAYAAERATQVHINIGPRLVEYRALRDGKIHNMASEYYKRGVRNLSINTDAFSFSYTRLSPLQHLFYQAATAAHYGLEELAALRAITLEPARALNIDDRVGSLKVGKDADVVIKGGTFLDVTAPVDMVLIDGAVVFQRDGSGISIKKGLPAGQDSRPPTGKEGVDASGQPGHRRTDGGPGAPGHSPAPPNREANGPAHRERGRL
jgi:imidazolonepropionase-like amidohydrolase